MKKASIIVSVDNSYAIINNFFKMLLAHISKSSFEIIVVNDCCVNIKTLTYLKELEQQQLIDILINLDKKHGFGKANNIGVKRSSTECLIFINSDIIINNNILDDLVRIYYQNKFAAFQPLLLYPQTQCIQSAGHIFATYFNRHALENNSPKILSSQAPIKRQSLTLAFCVIDKKAFWENGGFNEFYYNGYEGMELILKISQKYECALIPNLHAYHVRSVAVKNTTFDEEQKIPYFWCKCINLIKNDFISFIRQYIPKEAYSKFYIGIQLTTLDLLTEVKAAGLQVKEDILLIQNGTIELFSLLPFCYLKTSTPLLFLCDNFTQLKNNSLWIKIRNNRDDLVIDTNGNVKRMNNLI